MAKIVRKRTKATMENQFLGRKIRRLSRAIRKAVDANCLGKINLDLTAEEGMIVSRIGMLGGKVETKELLENLQVSKSTLSEVLSSLKNKEYIAYEKEQEDKRKKTIVLTEKGNEHVERANKVFQEFEETLSAGIQEEDREAFDRLYHQILKNLEEEGE